MTADPTRASRSAIRVIAAFEAFKGLIIIAAGSGLLLLIHKDLHALAATWISHAHLDPAAHYPRIFLDAVDKVQDRQLTWLALGAAAYAALRLVEAYGLFFERAWAEVLAAGSGAIYLPIELLEWLKPPTWLKSGIVLLNAAIVAVMVMALLQRRRAGLRQ